MAASSIGKVQSRVRPGARPASRSQMPAGGWSCPTARPALEHVEELLPRCSWQGLRFGMSVRADDHCRFFDLLHSAGFADIHRVKPSERGIAVLPGDAGALGLDLLRHGGRERFEVLWVRERIRGELAEDDIGRHEYLHALRPLKLQGR